MTDTRHITQFPHCDQRVLHAPRSAILAGTLISSDGIKWFLRIHRTEEPRRLAANNCISLAECAPKGTWAYAIRLTQPACFALMSKMPNCHWDSKLLNHRTNDVLDVELKDWQKLSAARSVLGIGSIDTQSILEEDKSLPPYSEKELTHAVNSLESLKNRVHALIVKPVSLGTSWNLTIETGGVQQTIRLPNLSLGGIRQELRQSWLNVIWSVLIATASELTLEQWRLEDARLSTCRHCDSHPEWQELREAWGIAFTNQELEEGQLPCPSDFRRGKGGAHVWGGNYPRPSVLTDCPACNGVGYNTGANMCGSCQGTGHIP